MTLQPVREQGYFETPPLLRGEGVGGEVSEEATVVQEKGE